MNVLCPVCFGLKDNQFDKQGIALTQRHTPPSRSQRSSLDESAVATTSSIAKPPSSARTWAMSVVCKTSTSIVCSISIFMEPITGRGAL
ncbi:hypothetical protein EMCRGX_G021419 [Ephydatia muelleri]